MAKTVMKFWGFANGSPAGKPYIGQYIKSFDHEAFEGRGDAEYTPNRDEALAFDTASDAFEFWRKQSVTVPLRPYGDRGPNRPLTAANVEFETL